MNISQPNRRIKELAFSEDAVLLWLSLGAVCLLAGLMWLVGEITFGLQASDDGTTLAETPSASRLLWACLVLVTGAITGSIGIWLLESPAATVGARERAMHHYQRYLVGVGYALLVVALINVVAFAGFAYSRLLPLVFPLGTGFPVATTDSAKLAGEAKALLTPLATALLLFVTLSMSVLGALFFIANSLRENRDQMREFDAARFWGDLWYRLGEAILFSVVFLLAIRRFYPTEEGFFWMPIFALFLGMFVQTGERLVFGLAKRVFAAAQSLVPLESDEAKPPASVITEHSREAANETTTVARPTVIEAASTGHS